MKNKQNVRFLTQLALLIAIELVLWQTPLGYLRIGALSVSFLTVPVAIGGMIMGPAAGAILGGVFGVTSMIDTFMVPGMKLILFQLNPFGWVMFVLVARILCGLLCGVVFRALNKALKGSTAAYGVGAVSCPFFNTFFFMGFMMLFYFGSEYMQNMCATFQVGNPITLILAMVGVQGVVEMVVCGIVATIVSKAVNHYLKK